MGVLQVLCWPWLSQRQGLQRLGVYDNHTAATTQSILVAGYRFETLYFPEPLWVIPQCRYCHECRSLVPWFREKSLYSCIFHPLRTATILKNTHPRLHISEDSLRIANTATSRAQYRGERGFNLGCCISISIYWISRKSKSVRIFYFWQECSQAWYRCAGYDDHASTQ